MGANGSASHHQGEEEGVIRCEGTANQTRLHSTANLPYPHKNPMPETFLMTEHSLTRKSLNSSLAERLEMKTEEPVSEIHKKRQTGFLLVSCQCVIGQGLRKGKTAKTGICGHSETTQAMARDGRGDGFKEAQEMTR